MAAKEPPTPNDAKDADLIRRLVRLVRRHPGALNRTKIIRDDIDYIWAKRREAGRGHRKRMVDAWWSHDALGLRGVPAATIGEHLVPMHVVAERMLELDALDALDRPAVLTLLNIPMAVITTDENKRLDEAGLKQKLSGVVDWDTAPDLDCIVWDRHVAVGLDVPAYRQFDRTAVTDPGPI